MPHGGVDSNDARCDFIPCLTVGHLVEVVMEKAKDMYQRKVRFRRTCVKQLSAVVKSSAVQWN